MANQKHEKNVEGKYIVPLVLPQWLARKIVLEVRAANENGVGEREKVAG